MYFKYILFLALALVVGSKGNLLTSPGPSSAGKHEGCTSYQFSCGDGQCFNKGLVCDLYEDCEDGSDENNCTNHVCGSGEFRCQSGQCIQKNNRCNGHAECADESDEKNCLECFGSSLNSTENENTFKCVSSNKCISRHQLCNSIQDCPDGIDEDKATCQNLKCREGEFQCRSGRCVPNNVFCEGSGYDLCSDDYNTKNTNLNCTECPYNYFKCKTGNQCIYNPRLCDTVPDCADESDESESTCSVYKCSLVEFQCQSGQCIGRSYEPSVVCNGRYDCSDKTDKSDEANCTTCSPEAIKCGSRECVHKLNLCNSIAECSDGSDENKINCPDGSTPPVLTPLWRESWNSPVQNVTLQYLTEDLAIYYDSSVSPSVTWPFSQLSQAWKYAKKTFELDTLSEPGNQFLYVVLGKLRYGSSSPYSFRSWRSGNRNIIDPGLRERNGWATQNSDNFEKLVSGLGNIVKFAKEGVENLADRIACGSSIRNIVFYDIYIHLKGKGSAEVMRWKAEQFNRTKYRSGERNCFRDWLLPVYEKYGGATVLNNYFHIFKRNWPQKLKTYSKFNVFGIKQLNVGEFVHFWSGAAGEDLRYLAKSAFNDWDDVYTRQFAKAQTDFPHITYPVRTLLGSYRN